MPIPFYPVDCHCVATCSLPDQTRGQKRIVGVGCISPCPCPCIVVVVVAIVNAGIGRCSRRNLNCGHCGVNQLVRVHVFLTIFCYLLNSCLPSFRRESGLWAQTHSTHGASFTWSFARVKQVLDFSCQQMRMTMTTNGDDG